MFWSWDMSFFQMVVGQDRSKPTSDAFSEDETTLLLQSSSMANIESSVGSRKAFDPYPNG